jgi:hypothetical protein
MTRPRRKSSIPPLGLPPDGSKAFFSAEEASPDKFQVHMIFRRRQLIAWRQINAKALRGQRPTKEDLRAIEPAAKLFLQITPQGFDASLLINTNSTPQEESDLLIELVGESFCELLNRDGQLLVYYTDTPHRYEWS